MRKIISTVLIMTILFTTIGVNASTKKFSDVSDKDWFKKSLDTMIDKGIIIGYPDGTFKPNNEFTKIQYIVTLVRALGYTNISTSNDVWYKDYLDKAQELGIITVDQSEKLTEGLMRAEMAHYTVKALEIKGESLTTDDAYSLQIDDWFLVNDNYKQDVLKCYSNGIITGYPDGEFKGGKTLSRAEALVVLDRLLNKQSRQYVEVINKERQDLFKEDIANGNIVGNFEWYGDQVKFKSIYPKSNPIYVEPRFLDTTIIPKLNDYIYIFQKNHVNTGHYVLSGVYNMGEENGIEKNYLIELDYANNAISAESGINYYDFRFFENCYFNGASDSLNPEFSTKNNILIDIYQLTDNPLKGLYTDNIYGRFEKTIKEIFPNDYETILKEVEEAYEFKVRKDDYTKHLDLNDIILDIGRYGGANITLYITLKNK